MPSKRSVLVDLRRERASIEALSFTKLLTFRFEAIHQVVFAGNVETLKRMVDSGANPGGWRLCIFLWDSRLVSFLVILVYSCHHELNAYKCILGEVSSKVWRGIHKRSVEVFCAKLGFLPLDIFDDFC